MDNPKYPAIGVMIGGVYTNFPREVIKGISEKAAEEKANVFYFLRVHTAPFFLRTLGEAGSSAYDYQFNTIHDYCKIGGLDGIIINYGTIGFHMNRDNAAEFITQYNRVPLIIVTEQADLPNCYSIISDNRQGMFDVVEHLITKHNCRKILFVRGPESNTDANERLQGYMDAMTKYGLPVTPKMIGYGDFSDFVDSTLEELLDANPGANAIAFSNDEMAASAYRVCPRRGITIGKDLLVTGYDYGDLAKKLNPPLTSVFQDAYGMGKRALSDIVGVLNGKQPSTGRYPVKLAVNQSCGCPGIDSGESSLPRDRDTEIDLLREELRRKELLLTEYQGKSWFIPMMARDLSDCVDDEAEFCGVVMEKLQRLGAKAAYLFLLEQPAVYDGKSEWHCPEDLHLAAAFRSGRIKAYPIYDRPAVTREHGIAQYTEDGQLHQFAVFLLFSGERQYGLLACDVDVDDQSLFYVASLQIGLSLRYFEINRIETLRRRQMTQDMEQMRRRNQELDSITGYDHLTGLLNLRGLTKQVNRLCEDDGHRQVYVLCSDLDHLKQINDNFGHPEGNFAIKTCAQLLHNSIRETDLLARVGGDEFICVISADTPDFGQEITRRLHTACDNFNRSSDKDFVVEMSVGVVETILRSYKDFEDAIADADRQLYEAKKHRRASVKK